MGELCHFLGREFVCVIFSWPAGGGNIVSFGYDVDRESGEFATEDLKRTIRMIADTPGLQKIHLVAHSRGTDLLATAVSDLSVEVYITQTTLARRFKIGNIVLIAPDLDIDVALTKIWKTSSDPDLPYGTAPNPGGVFASPEFHITVYVSPDDKALAISGWVLGSIARLGRIDMSKLQPEDIAQSRQLGSFDVIEVSGVRCFICHSYFVSDRRVSSDLIAMLRYGLTPNEPGRPLIEVERPFWRVPTGAESNAAR
jgi:esterase/lipase superfamily enzyme